jgi:hypothetical protein
MSTMLPLVEELADLQTHVERGAWLLRCPLHILYREQGEIRTILRSVGFGAGLAVLDCELMALDAVRLEDGSMPFASLMNIHLARIDMAISQKGKAPDVR